MENICPLVSEIIPLWNKKKLNSFFFLIALLFSGILIAQKGELDKFNDLFFEAEKQKSLGNTEKAKNLYLKLYNITDTNSTVAYELGIYYLDKNQKDSTIFFAERAAKLHPGNKWFKLLKVAVYQQYGLTEKQIKVLKELIEAYPKNLDYLFELSLAYVENDESKKAINTLHKLEKLTGFNEIVIDQKKKIYLQKGDLDAAVKEQKKLIEVYPKELSYYGQLAQIYQINGFGKEAFDIYQTMLQISPSDPSLHLDLAQYYRNRKEYEKSFYHLKKAMTSPDLDIGGKIPILISLFNTVEMDSTLNKEAYQILENAIASNPKEPKVYIIYGDFLNRDGRGREALTFYRRATRLKSGNTFLIWEQILLLEMQYKMYDTLIKDAPKAVELFPNQPLPYFFAGVAFAFNKKYKDAIYYLEDGINYVIGNLQLKEQFYLQLADAHHHLEENEESDQYFEKALLINNQNLTTLNNYAYYLSVRGEKLNKALAMTEKSNVLSPANPVFLDTWAWVLYKKKEYDKALEKMEQVIELDGGNNGEILEHYGDILFQNGMTEKAIEQWGKAKNLGNTSPKIDEKIQNRNL